MSMAQRTIQHYVALGDSLSAGISDWGQGDPAIGFAALLAAALRESTPDLRYTNLGVGGARVADVLREQAPRAVALEPDLVTLVVGANDVPGTPEEQFRSDYRALIETLRAGVSGLIVVADIPQMAHLLPEQYASYRAALRSRVAAFNTIIAETVARHDVLLVELSRSAASLDPGNLSDDGLHPNARGYREMARAFARTLSGAGLALALREAEA